MKSRKNFTSNGSPFHDMAFRKTTLSPEDIGRKTPPPNKHITREGWGWEGHDKIDSKDRIKWECSVCKQYFYRESDYIRHSCHFQ